MRIYVDAMGGDNAPQAPVAGALEALEKKEIVQIPLKEIIPPRSICLIHDCQHPLNSAARELKKIILEEVSPSSRI